MVQFRPHLEVLKRATLALVLALAHGSVLGDPLPAADRAKLLADLAASRDREPAARAEFRETRTTRLLAAPLVTEGTVWFEAPDRFRREVRGNQPSVTASDGRMLCIHYPAFGEAECYPIGKKAFFDDSLAALTAGMQFERMEEHYRVAAETLDDGWRLVLTPRRAGIRRVVESMTIDLDRAFLLRRTELRFPNGDFTVTEYRGVRRSRSSDTAFTLFLPEGTRISYPLGGP